MPDWSYQPLFKPVLFRMPPQKARHLVLQAMGTLAATPIGVKVLDWMGDMLPLPQESVAFAGKTFGSRVGLGAGLVFDLQTIRAFSRLGCGSIEVGPVTVDPVTDTHDRLKRDPEANSLVYANLPENPGLSAMAPRLEQTFSEFSKDKKHSVRLGVRIANLPGSTWEEAMEQYAILATRLTSHADFITIDTRWWSPDWTIGEITHLVEKVQHFSGQITNPPPLFILVEPGSPTFHVALLLKIGSELNLAGWIVSGGRRSMDSATRLVGKSTLSESLTLVSQIREFSPDAVIIGSGGIIEPRDALDFFDAGATMVQLHSGFVYSGPGLAKRINECVNYCNAASQPPPKESSGFWQQGWIGFALVSIGLIVAGFLVLYVGLTSVLLPYDEAFLGITTTQLPKFNESLLQFMSHDRVTLAGTSLSGAFLFLALAVNGIKNRHRWAYRAETVGMIVGFLSFFLYLGFQYFDPLHALVSLLVLPFFLWGVFKPPQFQPEQSLSLHNDAAWRKSLIGQFLFVMIGVGLLLAGMTIAFVGCSCVFVQEDLQFMGTSHDSLLNISPKLIPLIAHDRASFGGSLWAVGVVELLTALHGYRQGNRWVWWALCLGGLPGFLAVFGIHFAIGYTSFVHLFPGYIAAIMYLVGLVCSYEFLCAKQPQSSHA